MGVDVKSIWDTIVAAFGTVASVFSGISIFDIVDILVLTFIIYKVILFCRNSRAKALLKGISIVIIIYILSIWFDMIGINWILEKLINYAFVILAIVFQPELRSMLERVGHSRFGFFGKSASNVQQETIDCINEVCKAVHTMSDQKIGALIVFENKTPLGEISSTGTSIDAVSSAPVITNIFFPKSPLHDGAMVIRDGRIQAAACILPLTTNSDISLDLGTRHRAAIGISENSDAVTVVVSEETGTISLTKNGIITRGFNSQSLQQELYNIFVNEEDSQKSYVKIFTERFKKKDKKGDNDE